ncbi:MAG: hypothetical protein U5K79_02550 [Cyclobacteriaceae bacterium]|nr:hypothetical protein [Cyclobacteriaceae bacterium]
MKVKGSLLSSVQSFIKENFNTRYQEWVNALPEASKKIYTNAILASEWYPYEEGLIQPTTILARLFYNNDLKQAAWQMGDLARLSVLKGIYKVFALIATPQFIMKRGGKIISSFYDQADLCVGLERPKGVDLYVTKFPSSTIITENRIGGWVEGALEICGVKNVQIEITKSITKGDDKTVYIVNWD